MNLDQNMEEIETTTPLRAGEDTAQTINADIATHTDESEDITTAINEEINNENGGEISFPGSSGQRESNKSEMLSTFYCCKMSVRKQKIMKSFILYFTFFGLVSNIFRFLVKKVVQVILRRVTPARNSVKEQEISTYLCCYMYSFLAFLAGVTRCNMAFNPYYLFNRN